MLCVDELMVCKPEAISSRYHRRPPATYSMKARQGAAGQDRGTWVVQMTDRERRINPEPSEPEDLVDEAGEETFPASDPPSWQPVHPGPPAPPGSHEGAPSKPRREEDGETPRP